MVSLADPFHRQGPHGAFPFQKGLHIVDSQNVVGAGQKFRGVIGKAGALCERLKAGGGIGKALPEAFLQTGAVLLWLFQKNGGDGGQFSGIPAFAAETQMCHRAQTVQQGDGAGGEGFAAGKGIEDGKLQNQVRAAAQGHFGAGMLVQKGGGAALDEISAHGHHGEIRPCEAPGFFQLIFVTMVKGIVLGYDSVYLHGNSPCIWTVFPDVRAGAPGHGKRINDISFIGESRQCEKNNMVKAFTSEKITGKKMTTGKNVFKNIQINAYLFLFIFPIFSII